MSEGFAGYHAGKLGFGCPAPMNNEIEELKTAAPKIVEGILSFGDKVDMIIVHGSVLDKSEFRPGQSDLDVLVVNKKASFMDPDADLSAIKGPWTRINVSVRTRSVLRHRNFELSFIARVLRGKVIFSSGVPINIEPPEREVAKREVVQGLIGSAFKKMLYARTDEDNYLAFDARWLIARCACFALQAFLV